MLDIFYLQRGHTLWVGRGWRRGAGIALTSVPTVLFCLISSAAAAAMSDSHSDDWQVVNFESALIEASNNLTT